MEDVGGIEARFLEEPSQYKPSPNWLRGGLEIKNERTVTTPPNGWTVTTPPNGWTVTTPPLGIRSERNLVIYFVGLGFSRKRYKDPTLKHVKTGSWPNSFGLFVAMWKVSWSQAEDTNVLLVDNYPPSTRVWISFAFPFRAAPLFTAQHALLCVVCSLVNAASEFTMDETQSHPPFKIAQNSHPLPRKGIMHQGQMRLKYTLLSTLQRASLWSRRGSGVSSRTTRIAEAISRRTSQGSQWPGDFTAG